MQEDLMKKPLFMGGLVLVGFIAGFSINPNRTKNPKKTPSTSNSQTTSITNTQKNETKETEHRTARATTNTQLSERSTELEEFSPETYTQVLDDLNDVIQEEMLLKLMETNPDEALAFIGNDPNHPLFTQLIHRWSSASPIESYDWITANKALMPPYLFEETQLLSLATMAEQNPYEASARMKNLTNPLDKEIILQQIARGISKTDPQNAFSWLEGLSSDPSVSQKSIYNCYQEVMGAYAQTNPDNAASIVRDIQSPVLQQQLSGNVVEGLAEQDTNKAIAWLQSLENPNTKLAGWERMLEVVKPEDQQQIVEQFLSDPSLMTPSSPYWDQIMFQCAEKNLDYTASIFDQLPESGKPKVAEMMIHEWLMEESGISKAVNWVNQQPAGATYDKSSGALAQMYMNSESNPEKALSWAGQIGDPQERSKLLKQLVNQIENEDLTTIRDQLSNMNLTPDDMNTIYDSINKRIDSETPDFIIP